MIVNVFIFSSVKKRTKKCVKSPERYGHELLLWRSLLPHVRGLGRAFGSRFPPLVSGARASTNASIPNAEVTTV